MVHDLTEAPTTSALSAQGARRTVGASGLGTFIEWFEYASYAYLATIIAAVFFPNSDPAVALMESFGIFALAFLMRPIGGMFWGHFGDRIGPKRTLNITIIGMGIATLSIGILPPYAILGPIAPLLLLAARMLQSFCAAGEYSSAAVLLAEHAPRHRRARWVSAVPLCTASGFLGASMLVALLTGVLSPEAMESWGWRIPFLVAAPLTIVVWYIRRRLEESPIHKELEAHDGVVKSPLGTLIRRHWPSMLRMLLIMAVNAAGYYLVLTYMVTYIQVEVGMTAFESTVIVTIALIAYIPLIFLGAWLADRYGRRRLLMINAITFIVLSYPAFVLLGSVGFVGVLLIQLLLVGIFSLNDSTFAVYFIEAVPAEVRLSGFALPYNFGVAIFGGSAPLAATWLISVTGDPIAPAYIIIVLCLAGAIALWFQGDPYADARRRAPSAVTPSNPEGEA